MLQAGNFSLPPLSSTFPDNFLITLKGEKKNGENHQNVLKV